MAGHTETPFFKKVLFALWAMVTLILLFSVILLTNEMIRMGQNPLTLPEIVPDAPSEPALDVTTRTETRDVPLYFANADSRLLVSETRLLPHNERTLDNCRAALQALIQGPVTPLQPLIPPTVTVRGMYLLEGGELVVDFSYSLQTDARRSASEESLLLYSVVNTLTQPSLQGTPDTPVRSVRFLIGGLPPTDVYPAHLDLSAPITADSQWLLSAEGGQADHA